MGILDYFLKSTPPTDVNQGNGYNPSSEAVPLGTPLPQRQQIAQGEAKQYNEKDFARIIDGWIKDQQKDPNSVDLNPPFDLKGTPLEGKRQSIIQFNDQIVGELNKVDSAHQAGKLNDQQYQKILDMAQPSVDLLNTRIQYYKKDLLQHAQQQRNRLLGKYNM